MAHSSTPIFSAVSSSARQLLTLLRCIAPAKKAQVLISAQGLRFSTEEGSVMESFVFLEKQLFTSYTYQPPPPPSSQDDPQDPLFEINLNSLIETLNIFSLSDPAATKRLGGGGGMEGYDALAAHRLNRHAGINPFSTSAALTSGICSFTYQAPGHPLSIHMSESGVTTTCDLTTYQADTQEDIPFARDALALKAILRSSYLLDAVTELGSMSPETLTLTASSSSRATTTTTAAASSPCLSLSAAGALGSATVDFTNPAQSSSTSSANSPADSTSESPLPPILETFFCPTTNSNKRVQARFPFGLIRSANRAMAVAQKVSLRLDEEGVLSLQFLIPVMDGTGGGYGGDGDESGGGNGDAAAAFVDFRIVPLAEGNEDGENYDEETTDGDGD
ncbi:hypothetical protein KC343_g5091 [Hortaea werneckii]|nr:hypothetical protein KC323_g2338 [Hortaea werneckii]KAI6872438.1 hypothetical protein KC338_g2103 [Hortaea werneckii]KAI7237404.1 hypothetical protein KC352_g14954 [Hortaea werneckii]KAI7566959.1 hypothetical protein KC317_g5314 [Hortaea werneckii]KAI7618603.1 hypothetical protein KC346_g4926 [Hortaea werneckii]